MASARLAAEPSSAASCVRKPPGGFQRVPGARPVAGLGLRAAEAGEHRNDVSPSQVVLRVRRLEATANAERALEDGNGFFRIARGDEALAEVHQGNREITLGRGAPGARGQHGFVEVHGPARSHQGGLRVALRREDSGDPLLGKRKVAARGGGHGIGTVNGLEERGRRFVARRGSRQVAVVGQASGDRIVGRRESAPGLRVTGTKLREPVGNGPSLLGEAQRRRRIGLGIRLVDERRRQAILTVEVLRAGGGQALSQGQCLAAGSLGPPPYRPGWRRRGFPCTSASFWYALASSSLSSGLPGASTASASRCSEARFKRRARAAVAPGRLSIAS